MSEVGRSWRAAAMSLSRQIDVWCDHPDCATWCEQATSRTAREARRIARRYGWTHSPTTGDRCPQHSRKAGR